MSPVSALDPLLVPFWLSTTMHRESLVLVAGDGRPAEGRLLFPPDTMVAVTNAAGDVRYVEGSDYIVDQHEGRIIRTPTSRMPEARRDAIVAADVARTRARLIAVTYTHAAGLWPVHLPKPVGTLSRVGERLRRGETLNVCLTGDSISEGYDASGFHGVPPYQPAFGQLVASGLEQIHGGSVRLTNLATAGWTAADALWDTTRISAVEPDLVIVAFGMNDACYAPAGEFVMNVSTVMKRVRDELPDVEFVVVSPMLPTPDCTWVVASWFDEYRAALAGLVDEGMVLADVTGLWSRLVTRKDPHDLSGNGLNHPNDFGHRLYAQTILSQLIRA
jgi:lysophospholipase L1-like esterase